MRLGRTTGRLVQVDQGGSRVLQPHVLDQAPPHRVEPFLGHLDRFAERLVPGLGRVRRLQTREAVRKRRVRRDVGSSLESWLFRKVPTESARPGIVHEARFHTHARKCPDHRGYLHPARWVTTGD